MTYYTKEDLADGLDLDESLDQLPDEETLNETVANIERRNISVTICETSSDARKHLADQIPSNTSVSNGRSTTLHELGFLDYLQRDDGFAYLNDQIRRIDDDERRSEARREAVTADVFFDSPNVIATSGEIVGVHGKGTSLGAWPYPAKRLILVNGTNKIVPTLADALNRVRNVAYPLEDARVRGAANHGSVIGKTLIYEHEKQDDRTELVLLNENYGF
jgi:hypothetical protein